jgi:translation initiation factor IF-3
MHKKKFKTGFRKFYTTRQPRINKNEFIRAEEVLVIDQDGNNLGVKKTSEALKIAKDEDLDLVEINPNSQPPVCKIIDYSKYLYDKNKKDKKNKATKAKETKEFRFSPVIQNHDITVRISRARKFLDKGHNVKLTIFRKGRQTQEQARNVMSELLRILDSYDTVEENPKLEGRKLHITIRPEKKKIVEKEENTQVQESQPIDKEEKESADNLKKEKILQKIKEKNK